MPFYRTECNYCCECIFVAIVITVGNNISALCNCGNDGGNYGFSKIVDYFCDDITFGTEVTSFAHACHSVTCLSGGLAACSWRGVSCAGRGRRHLSARVPAHPSSHHTHPSLLSCNAVCFVVVACYDVAAVSVCITRCVLLSSHACRVAAISVCIMQCVVLPWRARNVAAVSSCSTAVCSIVVACL